MSEMESIKKPIIKSLKYDILINIFFYTSFYLHLIIFFNVSIQNYLVIEFKTLKENIFQKKY